MNIKRCVKCRNYHYLSYAINSTITPSIKRFYNDATSNKYFHLTNDTIFELKLLDQFLADLLFKQSSFKSFCDAYNFQFATSLSDRKLLKSQRLTEIFYAFELIKFNQENSIPNPVESKITSKLFNSYYIFKIYIL